jgi:hypothetical protein
MQQWSLHGYLESVRRDQLHLDMLRRRVLQARRDMPKQPMLIRRNLSVSQTKLFRESIEFRFFLGRHLAIRCHHPPARLQK